MTEGSDQPLEDWKNEIIKSRRGLLRTSEVTSGKWSSSFSCSPLFSDMQPVPTLDRKQSFLNSKTKNPEVPPGSIPPNFKVEFGATGKNFIGGSQGQIEYGIAGIEGRFIFNFLVPKIGKEKFEYSCPTSFSIDKQVLINKCIEVIFSIQELNQESKPENGPKPRSNNFQPIELESKLAIEKLTVEEFKNALNTVILVISESDQITSDILLHLQTFFRLWKDKVSEELTIRKEQYEYFISTLIKLSDELLKKRYRDESTRTISRTILQDILEIVCKRFEDSPDLIAILNKIFDRVASFYEGAEFYDETEKFFEPTPGIYASVVGNENIPPELVHFVNIFGNSGGFQTFLNLLHSNSTSLSNKNLIVSVMSKLRRILPTDFLSSWIIAAKDYIFTFILGASDAQFKTFSDDMIFSILQNFEYIIAAISSLNEAEATIEQFKLKLILKGLKSDSLTRRIKAINDLVNLTKKVPAQSYNSFYPSLTAEKLSIWIIENRIIEILSKESTPEELRRSMKIFYFLTKYEKLDSSILDTIWQSCIMKEDDFLNALSDIFKELMPILSVNSLTYILKKCKEVPIEKIGILLDMIRLLSIYLMEHPRATEENHLDGLNFFWGLIQNPNVIPTTLYNSALAKFSEALRRKKAESKRQYYVEESMKQINSGESVSRSLLLLEKVLECFPKSDRFLDTVYRVIDNLQQRFNLLDIILNDLTEACSTNGHPQVSSSVIKKKLDFLHYLLLNSSLTLNNKSCDILWECLVISAPLQQREPAFFWFENLCNPFSSKQVFAPETLQYIFEAKICKIDPTKITEAGFNCWKRYFFSINHDKLGLNDTVLTFDLVGLPSLWDISLHSVDPNVSFNSGLYLNSMYDKLSHRITKKEKIREEFISNLMNYLDNTASPVLIDRCLEMLKNFLTPNNQTSPKKSNPSIESNLMLRFYPLKGFLHKSPYFVMTFSAKSSISQVKYKLLERIGDIQPNVCKVILYIHGDELIQSSKTLEELHIQDSQTIHYEFETTEESFREIEVSRRNILWNNQTFLDKLFSLLDNEQIPYDLREKIWEILMSLPPNLNMLRQFELIEKEPAWTSLINVHSPFHLLYSLYILESILVEESTKEERNEWKKSFLGTGGFQLIFKFLVSTDWKLEVNVNRNILRFILKILKYIMLEHDKTETKPELKSELKQLTWLDFEYTNLIPTLFNCIWKISKEKILPILEEISHDASLIVLGCVISNPNFLEVVYNFPAFDKFIFETLLVTPITKIRKEIAHFICQLCALPEFSNTTNGKVSFKSPREVFIPLLLNYLTFVKKYSSNSSQYFEVICLFVRTENLTEQFFHLLQSTVELVKLHPVIERFDMDKEDTALIGFFDLITTFLQVQSSLKFSIGPKGKSGMVHEIFNCLFELPKDPKPNHLLPPRCKTEASRNAAFRLLTELVKDCNINFVQLMDLILENHLDNLEASEFGWNYSPSDGERSSAGYVGLQNLGATCYMNAFFQQLYMIPRFKQGIIDWVCPSRQAEYDVMVQLQRMFCFLQESQKQSYDPSGFALSFRNIDGNPIDTTLQMDADEFFNLLCDKLETQLRGSPQESLLQSIWSGTLTTQLICKDCPHKVEKDDFFYTISLDIEKVDNIEDALKQYVKGEMLEGKNAYFCSQCETYRDTIKRSVIKSLPDVLILHLKRFSFNLDTMKKIKLNNYVKFPMKLNIFNYTKEGIIQGDNEFQIIESEYSKEYYEYELVGILVHSGTAEGGHYYSFIKERFPTEGECKWIEFNDRLVRPFDIKSIPEECFGGQENVSKFTESSGWTEFESLEMEKTKSAYMLIYEKKQTDTLPLKVSEKRKSITQVSLEDPQSFVQGRVEIPVNYLSEIWQDNMKFIRDKRIFAQDYLNFITSLLQLTIPGTDELEKKEADFKVVRLGTSYFEKIVTRSREKKGVSSFLEVLQKKFSNSIPACKEFLSSMMQSDSSGNMFYDFVIDCNIEQARQAFLKLVIGVLKLLLEDESKTKSGRGSSFLKRTDSQRDTTLQFTSLPYVFIENVILLVIHNNPKKNFNEFCKFIRSVAELSTLMTQCLINKKVVTILIDYFLESTTQNSSTSSFELLDLCRFLATGSYFKTWSRPPPNHISRDANVKITIPQSEIDKMTSKPFVSKMFLSPTNKPVILEILIIATWENELKAESVLKIMVEIIQETNVADLKIPFEAVATLLLIEDNLAAKRAKVFMTLIIDWMISVTKEDNKMKHSHLRQSMNFLQQIVKLERSKEIKKWIKKNESKWATLVKWDEH